MLRLLGGASSSLRRPISSNFKLLSSFSSSRAISSFGPYSPSSSPSSPSSNSSAADDEWNDAWETAWLPQEVSGKNRAPWETDVDFSSSANSTVVLPSDADLEAKAFVEEMEEGWNERRRPFSPSAASVKGKPDQRHFIEQVVGKKDGGGDGGEIDDYRMTKQRIHAGLWMKEIETMEETKLGGSKGGAGDIDRLLDTCSEIFGSGNVDLSEDNFSRSSGFKNKPDGWELTSRPEDGNIWEISQREEDVLLQEFERRIAYSKFQIASFIKTHIFSRRRPIDGWKYMIEEIGPNARRGKGSTQRLPALADPNLGPFREEKPALGDRQPPPSEGDEREREMKRFALSLYCISILCFILRKHGKTSRKDGSKLE